MNVRSLDVACGEAARSLVPCATDINFSSVAEPTNEVAMRPRFPSAAAAMAAWGFALFVAAARTQTHITQGLSLLCLGQETLSFLGLKVTSIHRYRN